VQGFEVTSEGAGGASAERKFLRAISAESPITLQPLISCLAFISTTSHFVESFLNILSPVAGISPNTSTAASCYSASTMAPSETSPLLEEQEYLPDEDTSESATAPKRTFARNLGASDGFALLISIVIGSGVFSSPGKSYMYDLNVRQTLTSYLHLCQGQSTPTLRRQAMLSLSGFSVVF
jgi:hypothetical protein